MELGTHTIYTDGYGVKTVTSENYNCKFDLLSGYMERYGKTVDDDCTPPVLEVIDFEVTTRCSGVNGVPCAFCFPPDSKVETRRGTRTISDLRVGHQVIGYDFSTGSTIIQTIKEKYSRDFDGELVCIELEDGSVVRMTPNHPVMLKDGSQVQAGDLTEDHEVLSISEVEKPKYRTASDYSHKSVEQRVLCGVCGAHVSTRLVRNTHSLTEIVGRGMCPECHAKLDDRYRRPGSED